MRVNPNKIVKEITEVKDRELTITERTTKFLALLASLITVGYFFMKIVLL